MAKFRSKIVEIEAVQWTKDGDHPAVVKEEGMGEVWQVEGHQGFSMVNPGDWIIAEPDGRGFYPCSPVTFEKRWEAIGG